MGTTVRGQYRGQWGDCVAHVPRWRSQSASPLRPDGATESRASGQGLGVDVGCDGEGCHRLIRPAGPVPWVLVAVSGNGLGIPLRARASTFRARSEGTGVPWGLPGNGGISVELGVCRVTGGSRVIGRGVSGCLGVSVSPPIVTGRIAQRNPHRKKVPRSPRRPPGASGGRDPYEEPRPVPTSLLPSPRGQEIPRQSPRSPLWEKEGTHTHTHGTRDDPLVVLGMVGRASPQPPAAPL